MNHLRNWSLAREIGSDKRETEGEFFGGEERIKFQRESPADFSLRERESVSRFTRYDPRNRRVRSGSSNHGVVITRRALPQEIFKGIKVNKKGDGRWTKRGSQGN